LPVLLSWTVLAGPLLTSCGPMFREKFRSPKVRVLDVDFAPAREGEKRNPWAFSLKLAIDNPNSYPLQVSYVGYSATVGDAVVADGERRDDIRIGASGITVVDVPLTFRQDAFKEAFRYALQARSLPYEFNGSVGLRTPVVGVIRIPFSKTGFLDPVEILKRKGLRLD
jgi:LEA14-like dessication related protein